ncbi:adenosine-phosphate deaminase [Fragilaria crotonensis]|nr:adenosine-phosphate deaminase [Fragilaria crotonensis]
MADEETPLPGGPPAPIALLRRLSSEVDAQIAERVESETINSNGKRRAQDPPARERPADGLPWPHRDMLSFTRSLIFYGAGSVTAEHETACRYIQESRSLRAKYYGGGGTVVVDVNL